MIGVVEGMCTERWLDRGGVKDVGCSGGFVGPYRTHQHPKHPPALQNTRAPSVALLTEFNHIAYKSHSSIMSYGMSSLFGKNSGI